MTLEFPRIYLLPTHLEPSHLHELEAKIPTLTYDINEAELVLGNISRRERALFELRHRRIVTEPLQQETSPDTAQGSIPRPSPKQRSISTAEVQSTDTADVAGVSDTDGSIIRVAKLSWLTDSLSQDTVVPLRDYLIYEGRRLDGPTRPSRILSTPTTSSQLLNTSLSAGGRRPRRETAPSLTHQTTSDEAATTALPPIPAYLHTTFSCQRPTLVNPPNSAFVEELKKVRTIRLLNDDQIGVRAYSTSIATLAAYPYPLATVAEVERLPGCGVKIAELFQEWKLTGSLRELGDAESNPKLPVLKLFYDIWGVGDATAREFYKMGWRDLDDLVQYAWDSKLSRVQQIGVKYYDELKLKIPRSEVKSIGDTILSHAHRFSDGFQMMIVGGYRRGKAESGDVDVILSHPDMAQTFGFIEKLVLSLEKSRFITHTLTLGMKNSQRGQEPVSWKGEKKAGSGFDTLDKAMVVWQNPSSAGEVPGPHRRVDIIISPWTTVGCAVLGWSGETTFQRDVRRYCKKELGLKFDSSGIRSRVDGSWVDLERGRQGAMAPDMETAEKRVFAGLGLEWRLPEERCTG